jgi:hypothetical protein
MQRFGAIYTQAWYIGLPVSQKELVRVSVELFSREERLNSSFTDYSFLVFPMAKAYEGFLKSFLYNTGLITREVYLDRHFRIGRALNPDVHPDRRDEWWLFDRVAQICGTKMGRLLWDTWLECRNQIFHYFPDDTKQLSLEEATKKIEMMVSTMEQAIACEMKH